MTGISDTPTMDYLSKACGVIEEFVGFMSYPYESPSGMWCIGYGTTVHLDGRIVSPVDHIINKDTARELLMLKLQKEIAHTLEKTIPHWKEMSSGQKGALVSFAQSVGAYFYGNLNFHTLNQALCSMETWDQVPTALRLYVNPGSAFEARLRARRNAEVDLWVSP